MFPPQTWESRANGCELTNRRNSEHVPWSPSSTFLGFYHFLLLYIKSHSHFSTSSVQFPVNPTTAGFPSLTFRSGPFSLLLLLLDFVFFFVFNYSSFYIHHLLFFPFSWSVSHFSSISIPLYLFYITFLSLVFTHNLLTSAFSDLFTP